MRREHAILMEGGEPAGGEWNFDSENRKSLPASIRPPERCRFAPDDTTREVMALVEQRFSGHFGTLEDFGWPVARADALSALEDFMAHGLPFFGDYQDAMKAGAPFLFHSLLAPALNIGLLSPREVCEAAEAAWRSGRAPLNAVEGFVRQILGWREYVRGVYWTLMPEYAQRNALQATRKLPAFYWTGDTPMRCLREAIGGTLRYAYSHHIQRLMVTGNFALLAGVAPREIERWYLAVYADAFNGSRCPTRWAWLFSPTAGRWRQALRRLGAYRPDVGLLPGMRLRREAEERPEGMPVQLSLLGFPDPAKGPAVGQSAASDAVSHSCRLAKRTRSSDPNRGRRLSRKAPVTTSYRF